MADVRAAGPFLPAASGRRQAAGWMLAMVGSAAFGIAGSFATPLIDAGWSPGAAVTARVIIAGLVLVVPAVIALRGRWHVLGAHWRMIVTYGAVAVAACQLFYFSALETLDVGIALLLEFQGIIMVVLWMWLRHHQRPRRWTLVGALSAIIGLVLILDIVGGTIRVAPIGVMWGLLAAVGLATHFVVSSRGEGGLPPIALAAGGLLVGAAVLVVAGAVGILPMRMNTHDVVLAGSVVPYWLPLAGVGVISAALAYVASIGSVRILGATLGSFVGLAEVLFAVLFAWVLLGQLPSTVQLVGGVFIVGGVALVRLDEMRRAAAERALVQRSRR